MNYWGYRIDVYKRDYFFKEIQNGNKNEEEKTIGTVFIPTPIFFNPMIKQTKGYYGKYL